MPWVSMTWASWVTTPMPRRITQSIPEGHTQTGSAKGKLKGVRIKPDQWVHLALVWGRKEVAFYANGELVQSVTVSGKRTSKRKDSESIRVGRTKAQRGRHNYGRGVEGIVDDVMAYHRALTPEQIATLAGK